MASPFAYIMLLIWPLISLTMFRLMSRPNAIVWTVIGGYLFLPALPVFDFPLIPDIDKHLIPAASAAFFCLVLKEPGTNGRTPSSTVSARNLHLSMNSRFSWVVTFLIIVVLVGPLLTAMANREALSIGKNGLPGLSIKDGVSAMLVSLMSLLPFLLGRKYLRSLESQRALLTCLAISGFIYSFLVLFEARMSPQLNIKFYGFFPHSFAQHMRGGDWRAIVFLHHGLWVGIFLAMSVVAAASLVKSNQNRTRYFALLVWMFVTLILSTNFGALLLGGMAVILIFFTSRRMRGMFIAGVAAAVLIFPTLRSSDVVPTDWIYEKFASINEQRANSLKVRFDNEDLLLAKANEKPLLGWGGYGRNRVFNPETGRDVSITDGIWVIIIGLSGWVGYLGKFGLLCVPLIYLGVRRGFVLNPLSIGLAMALCVNIIDLIPNATLTPVTWLVVGTLVGYLQRAQQSDDPSLEPEQVIETEPRSPYTRFASRTRKTGLS